MNVGEEKEHIYSIMRDITQERRKLTEIYFSLKERLDDLNKLEQKGLDELSVSGYVNLFNQFNKEVSATNIDRETKHVFKNINTTTGDNKNTNKEDITIVDKIDKKEIEIEKDRYNKQNNKSSKSKYINSDKVIGVISSVLKESVVPMNIKEIHRLVQERMDSEIKIQNLRNNIMPRAIKKNKNIQRATFGYYQYINA